MGVVLLDVVEEDELVRETHLWPFLARILLGEEARPPTHDGGAGKRLLGGDRLARPARRHRFIRMTIGV